MPSVKEIQDDEALLYVNYFGVFSNIVKKLSNKFKNLIIDNSQAFYDLPLNDVSTLYSPRKFFGLPDGGFVYTKSNNKLDLEIDVSENRLSHLIKRIDIGAESGYAFFQENDAKISTLPLRKMSALTNRLLKNIDFDKVKRIRKNNFEFLHETLKYSNEMSPMISLKHIEAPMIYPYLRAGNEELRKKLLNNRVYCAKYWPNVSKWMASGGFETYLQNNLIPLPIDQRYNIKNMQFVLEVINS